MTLEDETQLVTLVLWQRVWDEYEVLAQTLPLTEGSGPTLEQEIAQHRSCDFHGVGPKPEASSHSSGEAVDRNRPQSPSSGPR